MVHSDIVVVEHRHEKLLAPRPGGPSAGVEFRRSSPPPQETDPTRYEEA